MKQKENLRAVLIYVFFLFLFLSLSARIIYLQLFRKEFLRNLAASQHYRVIPLEGNRGTIYDRNGRVLVTGINCYSVFADPALVQNAGLTASQLAPCVGVPEKELIQKLVRKSRFVWIKRKMTWDEKQKIKALKLKGICFLREKKRFYVNGGLGRSILGVADIDNKGLDGLELVYDKYLRGKKGRVKVLTDSASRQVLLTPQIISPRDGEDIVLTIDSQVQYIAESSLEETVKKYNAAGGSVIVMDAATGEILALANYDNGSENSKVTPRNRAVCDMFEPGSTFKMVTLLAAVNKKLFADNDKFFCENGSYKVPGTTLHDWKPYGTLTFREVFMRSSNIGVAKIATAVGKNDTYNYIRKMGFGRKTGIDLPGEVAGDVKSINRWSNTTPYIIPIGQEIGVTLVQMARAFAVVANGGMVVKPHIVKRLGSRGFYRDVEAQSQRIFPVQDMERAKNILEAVVKDGTGKGAFIEGLKIGGKTGTAQKYDPAIGTYSATKYRASFMGFIAEFTRPLVIAVTVDEPKQSHFGGVVAAPLFKQVAQKTVLYIESEKAVASRKGYDEAR